MEHTTLSFIINDGVCFFLLSSFIGRWESWLFSAWLFVRRPITRNLWSVNFPGSPATSCSWSACPATAAWHAGECNHQPRSWPPCRTRRRCHHGARNPRRPPQQRAGTWRRSAPLTVPRLSFQPRARTLDTRPRSSGAVPRSSHLYTIYAQNAPVTLSHHIGSTYK